MSIRERLDRYLAGDFEGMAEFLDTQESPDTPREKVKNERKLLTEKLAESRQGQAVISAEKTVFTRLYRVVSVTCCIVLTLVMLYCIAHLPRYGYDNPRADEVVRRYVEDGLAETGAVNIVAGMILDYRAFDTLGESHVLFTALLCVTILLRIDTKNMRREFEDYYTVRRDHYYDTGRDTILRTIGLVVVPCIFVYGIYILLNGQVSPGGGFSGGAVMGAGLIIWSQARGFSHVDRLLTARRLNILTFAALAFYSLSKCYVFFMGANGFPNHIPKGIPGAILSGGLILPLDIAVGLVVTCTMYGFYSLFRRGAVGNA
ncbi:MAG: hypothetical protein IJL72_06605 [Lachnospiraceae bacterium]|nr:hypothetical protein [Lachnospiraceae bacterium]